MEEETISLGEIFEVVKKRFLLILMFIFGAALIVAVVSFFVITPTYESSSQFIVNTSQQDSTQQINQGDIRTNVELINTYNVIIKSSAILEDVVEEVNLPYSANTLSNNIAVSSEQNSQVVTVTATDTNPVVASKIANATVEIFQKQIPELMNVDNVKILTSAETPANPAPVAPNPTLNIAIAIVLGAMIGVGLAFLLEYLDTTITSEEDIEKHLGLPILGVISHVEASDLRDNEMMQLNQQRRGGFDGQAR